MTTESVWTARSTMPRFARLKKNLKVDVAIIGGGITGITAAYLLKQAGRKVALLERDRCGPGGHRVYDGPSHLCHRLTSTGIGKGVRPHNALMKGSSLIKYFFSLGPPGRAQAQRG